MFRTVPFITVAALLLLVVRLAGEPLSNPDTWFHLRIGREFLGQWTLSDPGALSRFATVDWVPTQWSIEMLSALFEESFGLPGVAWLFGLIQLIFVATLYLVCRAQSAPGPAATALLCGVFAASGSLSARPQAVSLVLLTVTVAAWTQTGRDGRPRWWLVPLTWVWATAHGFWSIGVAVGVVACVGFLLDRTTDRRAGLTLFAVPLASLVAACLTPVGPALLATQLAVSARAGLIGEWGPTSINAMPAGFAAGMFAAVVILWARFGSVSWASLFLLLFAVALAAYAVRMVALGGVIAAPLLAAALQDATHRPSTRPGRREVFGVWIVVALNAVVLAVLVAQTAQLPAGVPIGLKPDLADLSTGEAVIVDGPVGSWLEWEFPNLHPTMDGMFDAYSVDYMREYMTVRSVAPGWQRLVEETGANVALLNRNGALANAMTDQLGWREVGVDGRWVLLSAPSR